MTEQAIAPDSIANADAEIVARWKDEPAPLLPLLHAFHDRDGYLSEASIRAVSEGLRIPIAELWGTVHVLSSLFARSSGQVCSAGVHGKCLLPERRQ